MVRHRLITSLLTCTVVTLAAGACGGRGEETPAADRQTASAQPANTPTTVSGCLRAGEATDTFVLTVAQTAGSGDTATYHLTGAQGVNLRDHVGQNVEVSGTIRAQQEIASRTSPQPADRATGTSGTPTVQTRTEVDVKQLDVTGVKPLGGECGQ